jgi:integrase
MSRREYGNVRRLPSGRWQARYRDRGGRLIPASGTFASKGDAAAWLAKVQTDRSRGEFVDHRAGRVTVAAFAEQFLAGRILADRTVDTYRGLLDSHILPTLGNIEIGQLAPGTVRAWNARLARQYPSTAAKAYRLLRAMLNTAVADELIARTPCRVDGAGIEQAAERPIASVAEVDVVVDAMPARFRAIVLLATWCQLRKGELCALRRKDIDLMRATLAVAQNLQQLRNGRLIVKEPKSQAGRRTVAIPPHVLPAITEHLATFTAETPDALVFTGERGGPLRPHVLQKHWARARMAAGRPDLHLHDLRHTGNTWAAATGASTRELMARMGHATPDAALRYQHATEDRDRVIAEALADIALPAPVVPIKLGKRVAASGTNVARRRLRRPEGSEEKGI